MHEDILLDRNERRIIYICSILHNSLFGLFSIPQKVGIKNIVVGMWVCFVFGLSSAQSLDPHHHFTVSAM